VAGVVAAATVGAGLARLVDTPARYGQNADLTLVDAREDTIAALVADERVAALDVVTSADVALADGTPVAALALEHRLGALPVETVTGRAPARAGEVALGPRLASRLGVVPGDALDVRAPGAGTAALTVTGVVVVNTQQSGELGALGETLVVTPTSCRPSPRPSRW
jgi:ABC-type lipoprotein release transport system permease subunit